VIIGYNFYTNGDDMVNNGIIMIMIFLVGGDWNHGFL
jgi:hypothetical protein